MQKRSNWLFPVLILLVLSILLFFLFKLPVFKSLASFTQNLFSPFQSLTKNAFNIFGESSKIKQLQDQNLAMAKRLVDQQKLISDNKALRAQFETSIPSTHTLLLANIIGSPTLIPNVTSPENLILDKGEKDGVKVGLAVIYKDNLVGKVVLVSGNLSKVILITDPDFSTTAKTLNSQSSGIAKGKGSGETILDNVLLSDSLKKDDLVVSKGDIDTMGNGILPNLVIGKVFSVNKNPSALFQVAQIKSLLDFSNLTSVYIVKN